MKLSPAKSLRSFRFCVLAGVADARMEDAIVAGRFTEKLREFDGLAKGRLIEEFVNWPNDPESIVRFTRKYGPLDQNPAPGRKFRFAIDSWKTSQNFFRWLWERSNEFQNWQPEGGSLAFRNGWLTYTAETLYMFLYVDLVTSEAKRLRLCGRKDCPHPYFIAHHLKQTFCSEPCARWGQREWKRQWWEKHGNEWRALHRKGQGGTHGPRKAR